MPLWLPPTSPPAPPVSPAPSLRDSQPIGRGFSADVFDWGDGRVLKLFHDGVPRDQAEREFRATRAVHAARLPAPAAYELTDIGGRSGIVLERVDGPSLLQSVQERPWTLFSAVRLLAELHAQIHRCSGPAELPRQRESIAAGIDAAPELSAAERQDAHRLLAGLPEGAALCHGDFHPGNVILTARGPVVIDWDNATRGHALGDVACTSRLMRRASLPPWAPATMHALLRCFRPLLHGAYLRRYFRLRPGTPRELDAWEIPLAAAVGAWPARAGDL